MPLPDPSPDPQPPLTEPPDGYIDTKTADAALGCSAIFLVKLRARGAGPPYYRLGEKLIQYRKSDLDAWMATRRVTPEAEPTHGAA